MNTELLKDLTLLFVEDEDDIRKSMQYAIGDKFRDIIMAQNGDEGLKKFKKYNPNIVVTDITMPIMDGLSMTKEIKKISKDIPVIVLSAYSDKEKLIKAIDFGVDKYLIKPIDMEEFLNAISHIALDKIEALNIIEIGNGYSFHTIKRVLIKDDVEIPLTKKELAFISLLIKRLGTVVLHEDIKKNVWASQKVSDAAIRTFIKRIRDKVGNDLIKNVSGFGYKMDYK
ncbi:response regulator transcription factor [Campylobacter sputorum]|uniref:response regulator transcription factor n=1 Tax=Campylobacter sputorum TaxID=206 RepID=UPI00053BDA13|nr:response regulator transcription factor [Campylobacter sputorum]